MTRSAIREPNLINVPFMNSMRKKQHFISIRTKIFHSIGKITKNSENQRNTNKSATNSGKEHLSWNRGIKFANINIEEEYI
ncbi:MAG: hypothetical protein Tsb0015_16550 [Simkaniaceae bacterium]